MVWYGMDERGAVVRRGYLGYKVGNSSSESFFRGTVKWQRRGYTDIEFFAKSSR